MKTDNVIGIDNTQSEYIRKIRRRIEDFLRKTNDETIMEVAVYLNINTD